MQQREATSGIASLGDTSSATPAWLESFAAGDYYASYWNIHSQPLESLPYEALQICLISLARLALRAALTVTAAAVLKNPQLSDWQRALLSVTLGNIDFTQLLPQANTPERESQLLFYAGARQRTLLGRGPPPAPLFERCKQAGAQTVEARLAQIEQARVVEVDSPVSRLIRTAAQIQFAELNMQRGDFQQATDILTCTLEESLRLLGANHLVTAAVFDRFGEVMVDANRLSNTLVFAEQAFAIHLEAFGRHAPETSVDCYNIGATLARIGRHAAAAAYLEEALALRRTLFGDAHPATAATRTILGEALVAIRRKSGNAGITEEEAARAEPIRWERFDQKHAEGIDRLTRLALLFRSAGATDIARFYLLQAVAAGRDLPEDHLETSRALVELAHLWASERKLPDARACLKEALNILHNVPGEHDGQVAAVLHGLAAVHERIGDRKASLECRLGEIASLRRLSAEGESQLAEALTGLAEWYKKDAGDFSAARSCLEEALSINERTLDPADPAVTGLRSMLASTLSDLEDHAGARSQLEKVLTALQGAPEPAKPIIAFHRLQLALEELSLGSPESAKQNLEEGMSALKESGILQSLPPELLSGLAERLTTAGQFMAARDIAEPAWSRLRNSEQESEIGAGIASILGMTLLALGEYSRGRRLLERALDIRMKLFGECHVQTAQSLNNMAYALEDASDLDGALACYKRALAIRKALLSPNHSSTLHTINNIAVVLKNLGRYSEAREYYEEAFAIENLIACEGKDRRARVILGSNFGRLLYAVGEFDTARYWIEESLRIGRKLWPAGDSRLAGPLHALGDVLGATAQYGAASHYLEEALALIQGSHRSHGRDEGGVLSSMAALFIRTERPRDAWQVLQRRAQIEDFLLAETFCSGSERQRKALVETLQETLYGCLTLVLKHFSGDAAMVRPLFSMVLRRKGISAEALAVQRDAILGGRHPGLQQSLGDLRQLRAQLATLMLGPRVVGATAAARAEAVSDLTAKKERLETQIAQALPELRLQETFRTADVDSVARAVPDGHALVEFVRFPLYEMAFTLSNTYARTFARSPGFRYVAFVLPAKASDQLRMLDLGDTLEIYRHLSVLLNSIAGGYSITRDLGPTEQAIAEFDAENARWLRETLFDPIAKQVGECRKLILAPHGELNRLPFGVLPTASGPCLLESWLLSYIGVGRDLLRLSAPLTHPSHEAIVAAAPNFDLVAQTAQTAKTEPARATAPETTESPIGMPSAGTDTPGRIRDGLTKANWRFTDLSGAREEACNVGKILGVKPHTGDEVTLEWIRSFHSPWILHFATHGFFLEPERSNTALGSTGSTDHLIPRTLQNPLLWSGLALAGANSWLDHKPLPVEVGSGILTADDVTGLDLLNTELVVLSACNTGLGKESFADGVQGLRRSFTLAGARTVVMSLWKVPDAETRDLMVWFYKLLRRGAGRAEALRRAQRHIMKRHPQVFSWGAFICQGQPGPLTWPSQATKTATIPCNRAVGRNDASS